MEEICFIGWKTDLGLNVASSQTQDVTTSAEEKLEVTHSYRSCVRRKFSGPAPLGALIASQMSCRISLCKTGWKLCQVCLFYLVLEPWRRLLCCPHGLAALPEGWWLTLSQDVLLMSKSSLHCSSVSNHCRRVCTEVATADLPPTEVTWDPCRWDSPQFMRPGYCNIY